MMHELGHLVREMDLLRTVVEAGLMICLVSWVVAVFCIAGILVAMDACCLTMSASAITCRGIMALPLGASRKVNKVQGWRSQSFSSL